MRRALRYIFLLLAALCLYAGAGLQGQLRRMRQDHFLTVREVERGVPPEYALPSALLGSFRGFLISNLWMRATEMKMDGQFHEMVDLYRIITALAPYYPNSWAMQAHELAFNVPAEITHDPRERVFWVFQGIDLLRNEGIPRNPDIPGLYAELAWIFYFKLTDTIDPAYPYYRAHLAQQVEEILYGPGHVEALEAIVTLRDAYPTRESFLATPERAALAAAVEAAGIPFFEEAAALYAQTAGDPTEAPKPGDDPAAIPLPEDLRDRLVTQESQDILRGAAIWYMHDALRTRLNMDTRLMLELTRRFGPIDWRLPQAHGVYWGWRGQRVYERIDPEGTNLRYERMIYFSLVLLAHQGDATPGESGLVVGRPNPAFVENVIDYMDERIRHHSGRTSVGGMMASLENFMRTTVFNYYFMEDPLRARAIQERLAYMTGNPAYEVTLDRFLRDHMADYVNDLPPDRLLTLVQILGNQSYVALARGELPQYRERQQWARDLYRALEIDWEKRVRGMLVQAVEVTGLPSLDEVILSGLVWLMHPDDTRLSPVMTNRLRQALQQVEPETLKAVDRALEQIRAQDLTNPLAPSDPMR